MAYSWYEPREPSVDRMYRPRPKIAQQLVLDDVNEDSDTDDDEDYSEGANSRTGSTSSLNFNATTATNLTTASSANPDTASVYLRLRPLNEDHTPWEQMTVTSDHTLAISSQGVSNRRDMEKSFTFSGIFDCDDKQRDVYQQSVKKMVESDKDTVVLTYGTSGSGKTYTILGSSTNPGIVPRALYNLFGRYKNNIRTSPIVKTKAGKLTFLSDETILKEVVTSRELLRTASHIDCAYDVNKMLSRLEEEEDVVTENLGSTNVYVWVSFLEIYNEKVYDLLTLEPQLKGPGAAAERRKELKVMLNGDTPSVKNLRTVFVRSCEEVVRILNYGMQFATSGSTHINSRSSRSHCILSVDVIIETPGSGFTYTQYKFGDLAGSERLNKTDNMGDRLREAQHINTSLLVLSRCLDVLHGNGANKKKNKDLVPYRDSKLTMLIKPALQGLDNFVMIVNLLPAQEFLDENLHVLNFASIAKQLTMKPSADLLNRQRKRRFSQASSSFSRSAIGGETNDSL